MTDHKKNSNPLSDNCMMERRIMEHPIEIKGDYIVADRLENNGTLKLFEYMGGPIYAPVEPERMKNAVMVASAEIDINHEVKKVQIGKVDCNYGYDLIGAITQQILYFANFYGYSSEFLDKKKAERKF